MRKLLQISGYETLIRRYPKIPHFISVARLNNFIGVYLLLWPTLMALWIASNGFPGWHLLSVFVFGSILTRSAGCIINDIADKDFDGKVNRTQARPLAQGLLSVTEALMFMSLLLGLALLLVLTTNLLTLGLALLAALVAAIYPFTKRHTYLPQVVLGIAFSFGIPMAFAAVQGQVPNVAWLLLVANVIWTVAYDTQYAMVDRDDDLKIGLKSTAILFADMDKLMIALLQTFFLIIMLMLLRLVELGIPYYVGLAIAAGLFLYQQYLIRDRERTACLTAFRNNHWVGLAIFIAVMVDLWAPIT